MGDMARETRSRLYPMTRHGRNATASAVNSYHERKKDAGESL